MSGREGVEAGVGSGREGGGRRREGGVAGGEGGGRGAQTHLSDLRNLNSTTPTRNLIHAVQEYFTEGAHALA